jgi:hypothetical protein
MQPTVSNFGASYGKPMPLFNPSPEAGTRGGLLTLTGFLALFRAWTAVPLRR